MKTPRLRRGTLEDGRRLWCANLNELRGVPDEIPGYWQHGLSVKAGDVVFDVGANVGLFALDAAARGAKVHAFEPMPQTFAALQANARDFNGAKGEGHIEVHNLALGSAPGSAEFHYFPLLSAISSQHTHSIHQNALGVVTSLLDNPELTPRAGAFRRAPGWVRRVWAGSCVKVLFRSKKVRCEIDTVARMVERLKVERVALLKIDVEGAEWEVLQGIGENCWPRIAQIVAEVHDENGRLGQVCELLRSRGYVVSHEPVPVASEWDTHMVWGRREGA